MPSLSSSTAWIVLLVAGLFEMGWAIGLKYTHGFTRAWPTAWTAMSMVVSLGLLGASVRVLPVGTAYAVWTDVGAVGTATPGMLLFGESTAWPRLACLALVIGGIAGLKIAG